MDDAVHPRPVGGGEEGAQLVRHGDGRTPARMDDGRRARQGGIEAAGIVEVAAHGALGGAAAVGQAMEPGADLQARLLEPGDRGPADEAARAGDEDRAGHRAPARFVRPRRGRIRSTRESKLARLMRNSSGM